VALAWLAWTPACARPEVDDRRAPPADGGPVDAAPAPAQVDAAPSAPAPAPLGGHPWLVELEEPADGGPPAKLGVVSVPLGAREPRPLMIALHGGSDRPAWACGEWRAVANAYPFIVCPRGIGQETSLAWSSPADTKVRALRAIAATKKIFGGWVREAPIVIVGFSMGGTQAALLAEGEPATYRRVVLAESAYAKEPAMRFARAWAAGGGERAAFLCTTRGCEAPYREAARNVASHHVPARLNIAGTNEHGIWDVVVRSMRRDWPWVVEGSPGWEAYRAPKEEEELPGKTEIFEAR